MKELCATIPNAYWTNQYGNLDAMEGHYELTATEICADFDSLDYVFVGVSTAGTIAGVSRRLKEHYPSVRALRPAPGYAGALAIEGTGWRLRQWQWKMPQRVE